MVQPRRRINGWTYVVIVLGAALAIYMLQAGVEAPEPFNGRAWLVLILAVVACTVWAAVTNRFVILLMLTVAVVAAAFLFSPILQVWPLVAAMVTLAGSTAFARRRRQ